MLHLCSTGSCLGRSNLTSYIQRNITGHCTKRNVNKCSIGENGFISFTGVSRRSFTKLDNISNFSRISKSNVYERIDQSLGYRVINSLRRNNFCSYSMRNGFNLSKPIYNLSFRRFIQSQSSKSEKPFKFTLESAKKMLKSNTLFFGIYIVVSLVLFDLIYFSIMNGYFNPKALFKKFGFKQKKKDDASVFKDKFNWLVDKFEEKGLFDAESVFFSNTKNQGQALIYTIICIKFLFPVKILITFLIYKLVKSFRFK